MQRHSPDQQTSSREAQPLLKALHDNPPAGLTPRSPQGEKGATNVATEVIEDLGTNLQALRRTPGSVPHRHGSNPEHVHPDEAHNVFSHSHEYDVQDIGAVGTYSAGMWRALQKDRPSDSHGPEHWHLQHRGDK